MTTAFVDFAAQKQAKEQIAENVLKWTHMLIEALKDNYRQYSIRGHQKFVDDNENKEYHLRMIDELKNGDCPIDYVIETGKKYHKVIFVNGSGNRSVSFFVDKQTGSVYKSASWRGPAKGERCNLLIVKEREWALENADWSGGWLYKR